MQLLSLKDVPSDTKIALLRELGFSSDGIFVTDTQGVPVEDRYTHEQIHLDNMLILPGSTIVLDDNPVSIMSYLEEYGDDVLR